MSGRLSIPAHTIADQHRASDPQASAWVSANAGSGKTFVLAQRVLRLLLDGVPPAKILCLTFTKAAAANMSMRVFRMLADWTRLDDEALARAIESTGEGVPDAARLAYARTLFARTVETPGGLKIQTIHAFCEKLLHLFPFEANVAAGFEVIDDLRRADALAQAREGVLVRAAAEPESTLGAALRLIAQETSAADFNDLLDEAMKCRGDILQALAEDLSGAAYARRLGALFGLSSGQTPEEIERSMCEDGLPPADWPQIADCLAEGSVTDCKAADKFREAARARPADRLALYADLFFNKDGDPRSSLMTKPLQKLHPALAARLLAEQQRLTGLREALKAARLVERSRALVIVADAIFSRYEATKRLRGLLDFDDLIERAASLLARADAAWVLYKLDAGIDHILVDEAQDTSQEQWNILSAIAAEFLSGESARSSRRTIFAVGDDKQSIYSFQGARPDLFEGMRRQFARQHADAAKTFNQVRLHTSFRSSRSVLEQVDALFAVDGNRAGLSADDVATQHETGKPDLPGLVELWPLVTTGAATAPEDWRLPLDALRAEDPPVVMADRIARTIHRWLEPGSGECVHEGDAARPMRAGDILILVRNRGPFFESVIRALKDRGVPVAGADRLELTTHLAVQDLVALGRACLLPQDDLTLACVLKSPLVGLDDDDLIAIAPKRPGSLLAALEASPDPRHAAAAARLADWRKRAGRETPFGFYAGLLGADGGRKAMVARLGPEAGDAIDEFLREALAHEREGAPSLTIFLHRFTSRRIEIKRDMEAASDSVRVMTVHAAKGLEAKVVFLPDTCGAPSGRHDPSLLKLEDAGGRALVAWRRRKDDDPAGVTEEIADLRRKAEEEHRRLLYVAMTRAEERLYICGFHGPKGPAQGCWYAMIETTLKPRLQAAPAPWDTEAEVWRLASEHWPPKADEAPSSPAAEATALPDWIGRPAQAERAPEPPISPSQALASADQHAAGPADMFGAQRSQAALAGTLVHGLLQYLPEVPPDARETAARLYLDRRGASIEPQERARIAGEVIGVLQSADLAPLFGAGSRAEVSVAGRIERPGRKPIEIAGQIDRIVDTGTEVLIADFKSGTPRADAEIPAAYVGQLALYVAALAPLYPARRLRAFLVWTSGPRVSELAAERLSAALDAI